MVRPVLWVVYARKSGFTAPGPGFVGVTRHPRGEPRLWFEIRTQSAVHVPRRGARAQRTMRSGCPSVETGGAQPLLASPKRGVPAAVKPATRCHGHCGLRLDGSPNAALHGRQQTPYGTFS